MAHCRECWAMEGISFRSYVDLSDEPPIDMAQLLIRSFNFDSEDEDPGAPYVRRRVLLPTPSWISL